MRYTRRTVNVPLALERPFGAPAAAGRAQVSSGDPPNRFSPDSPDTTFPLWLACGVQVCQQVVEEAGPLPRVVAARNLGVHERHLHRDLVVILWDEAREAAPEMSLLLLRQATAGTEGDSMA